MELSIRNAQDFFALLKRRKLPLLACSLFGIVLTLFLAVFWPPLYQSTATILIEEPDVPRDLISSTVTSYADQRIQVITQRVMNTRNLIAVIEEFGLYKKKREVEPISAVVEAMRDNILLELVSAEVVDPQSRRATEATIAFTLSFSHGNPNSARRVLNELVSLYLSENLRARRQKAAETTEFLMGEAGKYEELVNELETEVASFKSEHSGNLPEQVPVKMQSRDRIEREIIALRRRLQDLGERKIYLEAELSQLSPNTAAIDEWDPAERLRILEGMFIGLGSTYGADHPDLRKMAREIEALRKQVGPGDRRLALLANRDALLAELSTLRERYSSEHPDVVKLERQLATVNQEIKSAPAGNVGTVEPVTPSNPAYIQLQAQLAAINSEMRASRQERIVLENKFRHYEQVLLMAPAIEREYRLLVRDYEAAVANYMSVKAKQTQAELGEALEAESKSEQFSLIEPPTTPNEPVSPNYIALLALGFVGSLAIGMGCAFAVESLDNSVYGPRQLALLTGAPPLVAVPHIPNRADGRRKWRRRLAGAFVVPSVTIFALVAIQTYLMPLDVLWSVLERRLDIFVTNVVGT